MRKRLSLTTFALALAAGCGDATNPAAPAPRTPSFDGGWTIGSGGRSETTNPPSNSSTAGGTVCVSNEDGGGWTIGSGGSNLDADRCAVR